MENELTKVCGKVAFYHPFYIAYGETIFEEALAEEATGVIVNGETVKT